jgi:thiamine-phosphate pyrophosphorylase
MVCFDLCVITAQAERPRRGHVDVARAALEGGATIIQLREKELPGRAMLELAEQIRALTREHGAAFVVNDRVDIVLAAEADGAHLGVDDMPIAAARRLLGAERLIGASVDNPSDAAEAQAAGASYLGVGPVFPTGSKADAGDAIGLGPIGAIKRTVSIPVLAIGGLTCDNVEGVIRAGADGIAVISAVAGAADMAAAARALRECVSSARLG